MSGTATNHTAPSPWHVEIKLVAQSGYSPQIVLGERERGNPLVFQICVPHQDELYLSHGQLTALASSACAWLDLFSPQWGAGS